MLVLPVIFLLQKNGEVNATTTSNFLMRIEGWIHENIHAMLVVQWKLPLFVYFFPVKYSLLYQCRTFTQTGELRTQTRGDKASVFKGYYWAKYAHWTFISCMTSQQMLLPTSFCQFPPQLSQKCCSSLFPPFPLFAAHFLLPVFQPSSYIFCLLCTDIWAASWHELIKDVTVTRQSPTQLSDQFSCLKKKVWFDCILYLHVVYHFIF